MLNNFDGDDFVQQTQDILMDFDAAEVDAVILDLRYCHGGSIANAVLFLKSYVARLSATLSTITAWLILHIATCLSM